MISHRLDSALLIAVTSLVATHALAQQTTEPKTATPPIPETFTLMDFANRAGGSLAIEAPANQGASTTLQLEGQQRNLELWTRVAVELENPGTQPVRFMVRVQNENSNDWSRSATNSGFLAPRQRKTFNIYLYRRDEARDKYRELAQFIGMKGLPGGLQSHWHIIDATDVRSVQIELFGAPQAQTLSVRKVSATHPIVPAILREKGDGFFPFVDSFGQYKYADWPGKVKSDEQLRRNAQLEAADLKANPGSPQWDKYGGWQGGPQLEASGHFRTQKVDGKWWLVDPQGRLFWSHGPNSVGTASAGTIVSKREKFFDFLPERAGMGADLYAQDKPDAPLYFNFLQLNMQRQYGDLWKPVNRGLTHRRLRSWGMNTIGNWSEGDIQDLHLTPYTESLWPWSPTLGGDTLWDVFHPDFVKNFESGVEGGVKKTANDPWCIGYFVHNEMGWAGSALGTLSQILATAPETYTKGELVKALREKTPEIAEFNRKTGRNFADWDAVLASREGFDLSGVREDAEAFYSRYAEKYFQTVAEALGKFAPQKLYLGSRMHVSNPLSIRAAGKWCDVLSFNLYNDDISGFKPGDVDKPVIASEFHFGALDRGQLGTGLRPASNQSDRAAKYSFYVEGAARNPYIVGAHWFAYCPQALTGRGDGENYDDGLFDITNNPYPELRAAVRKTGYALYQIRSGK